MEVLSPERVDPAAVPAEELVIPDPLDLSFEGWRPEAFDLLERLRQEPHIGQYRKERDAGRLDAFVKEPFKRYRDDLALNFVFPNRLAFETEKNVFSRLLKNDFGAGGCHHHKWMAFYRPGLKRLKDVQLSHSLSPEGMDVGCYIGAYMKALLARAKKRVAEEPERFLGLVNPLLEKEGWRFYFYRGSGKGKARHAFTAPLEEVPEAIERADGIGLWRRFERAEVVEARSAFVGQALEAVIAVWPLYRFYLAGDRLESGAS